MTQLPRSVLGLFAHPDDETILAGGMMAMMVANKIPVNIVSATRGEGGESGEPPVVDDFALLGAAREAELRCAAAALGASLTILDYVDPRIGSNDELSPFKVDFDTFTEEIAALINSFDADVVLTHGVDGEYGHPAHKLINRAVMATVQNQCPDTLVYTVAANVPGIEDRIWNQSQTAHFALDITPWAEKKIAAMECHVSQHALFLRRHEQKTMTGVLRSVESVQKVWPQTAPNDILADLLLAAGAWRPEAKPFPDNNN